MVKYWGYVHQGYRNLNYMSPEEQIKELDKQYANMILKEFLTVLLWFIFAIILSVVITIILTYILQGILGV
jgi:hypothetical protein